MKEKWKTKSWFCEKTDKTDGPMDKLIKRKRGPKLAELVMNRKHYNRKENSRNITKESL